MQMDQTSLIQKEQTLERLLPGRVGSLPSSSLCAFTVEDVGIGLYVQKFSVCEDHMYSRQSTLFSNKASRATNYEYF